MTWKNAFIAYANTRKTDHLCIRGGSICTMEAQIRFCVSDIDLGLCFLQICLAVVHINISTVT